jgi:hypothetical protein
MVTYISRAQWGARQARGFTSLNPSDVIGNAVHWPGMAKPINAVGDIGFRRVCSALRDWQNYHMDVRGWSDIAYQIAVDQEGRAYVLRGLNIKSGANGDGTVNRKYGAILLVLAPGEQPSAKMQATVRGVMADFRRRFTKCPKRPTTHSKVRPAGTTCPGQAAIAAVAAGKFDAATPKPSANTGDDMPLTTADLDAVQARAYKANSDYAVAFWVAPTGTGTAIRKLLSEMKLQLDRIEDDTDQMAATQALLAEIDKNVDMLAAEAQAPKA